MPKVSVIIPIYGVEKYIERCARSLFEQTLDDMEFIFVDDCTQDNSIVILDDVIKQYPNRKDQVLIIHHKFNKGVSRARETGVQYAKGYYVGYCDSDDWVEPDMFEVMYSKALRDNLDIVKCSYYIADGANRVVQNVFYEGSENIPNETAISYLLSGKNWGSVWNTLVKRTVYTENNIQFTDDAMLEDLLLSMQLISHAANIAVLDDVLYYYFSNPDSICRTNSLDKHIQRSLQAWRNSAFVIAFVKDSFKNNSFENEIVILKYLVRRMIIPALASCDNYGVWNKVYAELGFRPCKIKSICIKDRIQYFLAQTGLYPTYSFLFKR